MILVLGVFMTSPAISISKIVNYLLVVIAEANTK